MRVLLFGASGQVGWELQRSLAPLGDIVAPGHDEAAGGHAPEADFEQPEAVIALIRRHAPDVIVNAAAYTAVDRAEADPGRAGQINAVTPGLIAAEAERLGAWMVHYSTDYVFDGSGTRAWIESDTPRPLSVYGATKLAGEQAIQAACARHLILRTSWVYGARGGNFARTMLRLARERDALSVVDDQIGAPTGADLLADVTAHALRRTLQSPSLAGLYHLTASGETSWHGYARYVLAHAPRSLGPLRVGPDQVQAVPTSAYPTPARRPLNSRMGTSRLRDAFGLSLPSWEQGVARMLTEIAPTV